MPAPISYSPSSTSPAPTARMSFLVQLFLGGSLAAIVFFLGVVIWRLVQLPHSDKSMAERPRPVEASKPAAELPAPLQTVVEIAPRKEDAALVQKAAVSASQPDANATTAELPRAPVPLTADQLFEQRLQVSEDDLRRQLNEVPELRLLADEDVRDFRAREQKARTAAGKAAADALKSASKPNRAAPIFGMNRRLQSALAKEERRIQAAIVPQARGFGTNASAARQLRSDASISAQEQTALAFNQNLQQSLHQAARRAGLTLQSGQSCGLSPNVAGSVAQLSKELRELGFVTALGGRKPRRANQNNPVVSALANEDESTTVRNARVFQKWCDQHGVQRFSGAVPTLAQMLQIENEPTRLLLVRELARIRGGASTAKLVERAIMDLSPEVRRAAVAALERRPLRQYVPLLTRGLRYPWPPVADHAAVALRTLKPQEATESLVDLLDLPSPSLPVLDAKTHQHTVRELVRLNHLRNCLLCHAPSANEEDGLVRGVIPTPGMRLPSSAKGGRGYYSAERGDFVRADITHLHQDFSLLMLDEDVAPWPMEQRYDFVTRLRTVPPDLAREIAAPANSPQRDAVLYALRGITGKDGGDSSDKWRALLGIVKKGSTNGRSVRPLSSGITIKSN